MHELPPDMVLRRAPLITALHHWAATTPDGVAVSFLHFTGRDRDETTVTYAQLADAVDAMAVAIEERTAPADRVALLMGQGVDYIVAFLACLRTGRLAVPLFGVDARRSVDRVRGALADAGPTAVVLDRGADEEAVRRALNLYAHVVGPADARPGSRPASTPVTGHETAYLQYTSGSTRKPAGVMVTQSNLAVAASQLRTAVQIDPSSTVVTWLPYFHDMGLVLGIGAAVQAGAHAVHMSPTAFVQQPIRWLAAISDFRATATVVPNFALDHATSRVPPDARDGLDLSTLRALGNGSEPIRESSLRAFTDMYSAHGFTHEAHCPGYGLAETTLVVTSALPGRGSQILSVDRDALHRGHVRRAAAGVVATSRVGAGRPIAQQVRIVDPETCSVVDDGEVGEVWVQGPNVCAGYFRSEQRSAEVFGARSPDLFGTWARTGDLATLVDGELYVVGRIKDLIIVGGKNHYPTDVEGTLQEALGMVRPNAVAVFAHTQQAERAGDEVAVAVIELDHDGSAERDGDEVVRRARSIVAERHELFLHEVVLAAPGAIPKTTSGKIQRGACAEHFARGVFAAVAEGA